MRAKLKNVKGVLNNLNSAPCFFHIKRARAFFALFPVVGVLLCARRARRATQAQQETKRAIIALFCGRAGVLRLTSRNYALNSGKRVKRQISAFCLCSFLTGGRGRVRDVACVRVCVQGGRRGIT